MNFNSEKIGYKNSSAHELLSKKYATFWRFLDFQAITLAMSHDAPFGTGQLKFGNMLTPNNHCDVEQKWIKNNF